MTYGEAMKAARKKRGLTLDDLSEKAEVHKATISKYEKGKRDPFALLLRLADALDISLDEYLGRTKYLKQGEYKK